jgi:tetratricopeptide (TPR) repeat protein
VGTALLMEYYNELPDTREVETATRAARLQTALESFKQKVAGRYTDGTLQRLLDSSDARTRRAAVLALGLMGHMKKSNAAVAALLHDEDRGVRQQAADALWSLWFRGDSETNGRELQRLVELRDMAKKQAGLDALIGRSPHFAEAYNQRAILYFQIGEWQKSITDCERVLKLNPHHFGAQNGMGQCYLQLGKPRPALKAFRNAYRINPTQRGLEDTIRALENALGEEGKK